MADTSRKRSRKSKLVPRECYIDEDLELQVPASKISKYTKPNPSKVKNPEPSTLIPDKTSSQPKPDASRPKEVDTSVLRKINASARESTETEETIPRKFEVNIEVEPCDDEELLSEPTKIENKPAKKQKIKIDIPQVKKHVNPTPLPLTLDFILDAANNLNASPNIADKILNIHLRNTIGYEHREKLVLSSIESQIQATLDEWRDWQTRSFYREDPLFYKCYICTRSYWYLSEFRDHLSSNHADDKALVINLEKYEKHEANVIAHNKKKVAIKDIFTFGLCYRCGRDFNAHAISLRAQDHFYRQDGCTKHFLCCTGLRDHFPLCTMCKVQEKPLKCNICKSRFDKNEELDDHLVLSHSVRSDVPIMTPYVRCKTCSERFEFQHLHNCVAKRFSNYECPHCLVSFLNNFAIEEHMKTAIKPCQCEICGDLIPYSCMKYDHMLTHTDNFMAVKKCGICDGLKVFVSTEDAKAHWRLKHRTLDLRRNITFPKVFVPWTCIYQRLTEIHLKEQLQKKLQKINKSTSLEPQASIREVQEESESRPEINVLQEEQDSDGDEKKSLFDIEENSVSESLQETLDSANEIKMENVVVKEEPEDLDSPRLIIKEEPIEESDYQICVQENQTHNIENQISVKQEILDEDEYEEDLIKLNFNLEDLLVKQEAFEVGEVIQESQDSDLDTDEESIRHTEDSMLEPEIIITGEHKKKKKLYRCTTCGFQAKHKEYRTHLEFDCSKNPVKHRSYFCTKCNVLFASMKKYLQHFEKHGYLLLSCPECLKIFKNYTYLGQHLQSHVKQNFVRVKMITYAGDAITMPDFQCKKCSKKVNSMEFFDHWETHVNAQPSHPVKVVSKPQKMDIHGQLHETIIKDCIAHLHKMPKECNHCHRVFKRTNECKRHIIEHLLVDAYNQKLIYKELRCQICDSGFENSDKYKQHMRDHASLPVYKCELCDRTFSDSSNFTKHKKVHNLRVVVCDLCGKKFQSKLSLAKHIEQHQNSTPIICEICKKIFHFDSAYRRHVRYFHDKSTTGFGCIICGDRFDRLKEKWDHMWEVHKERKHKADCPICHQSFRKYSDVRAHARTVHMMEISVLSVKKATDMLSKKSDGADVETYVVTTPKPVVAVGRVSETLVVYDSE